MIMAHIVISIGKLRIASLFRRC